MKERNQWKNGGADLLRFAATAISCGVIRRTSFED